MADSATRLTSDPPRSPSALDAPEIVEDLSAGSSARSSTAPVIYDDQKTVISKHPPLPEAVLAHGATPQEMGRILVGERLGHFQLEEFVGGGGMGAVFRATDTMLGRTVAVKVLSRAQTDEETLRRFTGEAKNAALLDSERIARVYYVNEDKGWHYIVFEYIDGVNVRDLVEGNGPLPLDEAMHYTVQVAEALRHAHYKDVVHRDIKPSNILVMADGRAKLVDMGLARNHQVESSQNDLTASGVTLGTFDYISPEQASEPRNADTRSDIYSLGCTLYYMLTGRPPFPDGTVLQKLLKHSSAEPPDPRTLRRDLPDEICKLLQRMLAKNPAQRFQTPDELITEILRIAERLGLERASQGSEVWLARTPVKAPWYEQHLPWAAPVVTLVLVILALEWLTAPPRESLAPPRPNLLPPVNLAERQPTRPQLPIAKAPPPLAAEEKPGEVIAPVAHPADLPPAEVPSDVKPMTPGEATPTPAPTKVLVVGANTTTLPPGSKAMPTLAAACAAAKDFPNLEAIELHYNGERVEAPLDLTTTPLTIRAAPGMRPVVVFRPSEETLAADRRMIRATGGRVTFAGLHFRLELPAAHAGEGWSLFGLTNVEKLELDQCSLTIRNASTSGALLQSGVAFIDFLAAPASDTLTAPEKPMLVRPLVRLNSTLARGEAPLVRSMAGTPFELQWTQGLLATTDRLVEVGGAAESLVYDAVATITLDHITVAAKSGLCLFTNRLDAPKHLAANISATDCIFLTDTSAPLIEHRTHVPFDELKKNDHPNFTGEGNIFAGPRDYWRIVSQRNSDPVEPTTNVPLEAAGKFGFEQPVLLSAVMWQALPSPARQWYTHVKADYLLSDDPVNPALRRNEPAAGFDPAALPEFPAEVATAPLPAAPNSDTDSAAPPAAAATMSEKMKMTIKPPPPDEDDAEE